MIPHKPLISQLSLPVVLASTSRARKQAFREVIERFETEAYPVKERGFRAATPQAHASLLADAKAEEFLGRTKRTGPYLLVTGDQLAVFNGQVRGKPVDHKQAAVWLREYRYNSVLYVSAVRVTVVGLPQLMSTPLHVAFSGVSEVRVSLAGLPEEAIAQIAVPHCDLLQCAGGLMVEHERLCDYVSVQRHGATGTDGSTDDAVASVMGLPLTMTARLLRLADRSHIREDYE